MLNLYTWVRKMFKPKRMKVSAAGLKLIQHYEGLRLEAYQDSVGIWTIGYGNTFYEDGSKVKMGDRITRDRADELLKMIVPKFEAMVLKMVTRQLLQNEFDALVSFAYNAGTHYKSGSVLKPYNIWQHVNNNLGKDAMLKYWQTLAITAGGKKLNGLVKRRKSESELYCLSTLNLY